MFKNMRFLLLSALSLISVVATTVNNIKATSYENVPENCSAEIEMDGFVKIGHKYYLIESQNKVNWYDAAHICRSHDAHLAVIENAAEMNALSNYLKSKGLIGHWLWLSGNDLIREGTFKWLTTGRAMTFTKWSPGQPDNAGGNENCVHLWIYAGSFHMNDWICQQKAYYICQANSPQIISFTVW